MAPTNRNIHDYFRRIPPLPKPVTQTAVTEVLSESKESRQAGQHVVRSSDDEESDSDSSLEDLADMLKYQSATQRPVSIAANGFEASQTSRLRSKGKPARLSNSPIAAKPKLMFDMRKLVDQAKKSEAIDASALRLQALLDDTTSSTQDPKSGSIRTAENEILESVVVEQEGTSVEQVLRAVKRTEAIRANKKWEFFEPATSKTLSVRQFPYGKPVKGWKADLADPQLKEQHILSGFARDMVTLGDSLPDELFLWMLDEVCLETREDLYDAYGTVLLASPKQIRRLVRPEIITYLFRNLGAKKEALDINRKVKSNVGDYAKSEGQDLKLLRAIIKLIGRISEYLIASTCSFALCILARLCIDDVVPENTGLLAAVQETMKQISSGIRDDQWQKICKEVCHKLFNATDEATLRFQMLSCIPATMWRVYEVRRRLALAFFFNDVKYTAHTPQELIDLSEIRTLLEEPQFKIDKETDYRELAALISILDIAIDDGQSTATPLADSAAEQEFNMEVDALAARIYIMWSHISDAGASYMSRIDAKEALESLRHRLTYAVRTKPKPRKGIFDSHSDNAEIVKKQSTFMMKHFRKESISDV